jgi:outer membrane protein OmpA-like peptidoglycan-associated protein
MHRLFSYLLAITLSFFVSTGHTEDLEFPKTQDDIVDALTFKNKKATVDGVLYERGENGEVFQVIDGERYRMRAIRAVKKVGLKLNPKLAIAVNFKTNSASIKENSYSILNKLGKALGSKKLSSGVINIEGHTDSRGSAAYNLELSKKRAYEVKRYLVDTHNISPERLTTYGYGESKPIVSNYTREGRQKNRRVVFVRVD